MSTHLTPFHFNDSPVRVIEKDGEPWFVAADVCAVLELSNPRSSIALLEDDERGAHSMDTPGGKQEMATINEPGLYSLVMRSRKPEAKAFKRWVTREVLPAIRRHGGYLTDSKLEEALLNPDVLIRLATDLKTEREARQALEAQAVKDAPKVLFADSVAASDTTILVGELAKILRGNGVDIGANRLFRWLRAEGYLIARAGSDWNMPTQYSMDRGWFRIKETAITHADGHVSISKTPKVTGKGQTYFINRLLGKQVA